jgi:hypothetical protein
MCFRQRSGVEQRAGEQAAHAREKGAVQFLGTHDVFLQPAPAALPAVAEERVERQGQ